MAIILSAAELIVGSALTWGAIETRAHIDDRREAHIVIRVAEKKEKKKKPAGNQEPGKTKPGLRPYGRQDPGKVNSSIAPPLPGKRVDPGRLGSSRASQPVPNEQGVQPSPRASRSGGSGTSSPETGSREFSGRRGDD